MTIKISALCHKDTEIFASDTVNDETIVKLFRVNRPKVLYQYAQLQAAVYVNHRDFFWDKPAADVVPMLDMIDEEGKVYVLPTNRLYTTLKGARQAARDRNRHAQQMARERQQQIRNSLQVLLDANADDIRQVQAEMNIDINQFIPKQPLALTSYDR